MNEMTHVEVTSLLLLMNTFYTASQGRCGHLTTKTPEKKHSHDRILWLNSHLDNKWKDLAHINDFIKRSKLGCKANQSKEVSAALHQKRSMLKMNLLTGGCFGCSSHADV